MIVPRRAFFAEWEGLGGLCWIWFVINGLDLQIIMGFCALLQRMGIFAVLPAIVRQWTEGRAKASSSTFPAILTV
jgi:hypothetical protein